MQNRNIVMFQSMLIYKWIYSYFKDFDAIIACRNVMQVGILLRDDTMTRAKIRELGGRGEAETEKTSQHFHLRKKKRGHILIPQCPRPDT